MNQKAFVKVKNVYGEDKYYPDCDRSLALAQIAGTKTLTKQTMRQAYRLGLVFELRSDALDHRLPAKAYSQ